MLMDTVYGLIVKLHQGCVQVDYGNIHVSLVPSLSWAQHPNPFSPKTNVPMNK